MSLIMMTPISQTETIKDTKIDELPSLIGLEIHVQLTQISTKLFCGCNSNYRNLPSNSNTCPVCLGLPGSLPVINPDAISAAIRLGTALHMQFPPHFVFSRKNYYYPDLPKNFQITQFPREGSPAIAINGYLDVHEKGHTHRIRIRRIQLEEDPGRLIHQGSITKSPFTLIDYNRSGLGLIEIVTEPDIANPAVAQLFLRTLRAIVENQDIANCDLEGAMRVDANSSIKGHARVEIKNITGHREVKKALEKELQTQRRALRRNRPIKQVTKHWDAIKGQATVLREKEEEQDYKYFPEPNLPAYTLLPEYILKIQEEMPETIEAKADRFLSQYQLRKRDVQILVLSKDLAEFFESIIRTYNRPTEVANWINNVILGYLNENDLVLSKTEIKPSEFIRLLRLLNKGTITQRTTQDILKKAIEMKKGINEFLQTEKVLSIIDVATLQKFIDDTLKENPDLVSKALKNPNVINRILGLVIMKSNKKADPTLTRQLIQKSLGQ